MKSKVSVIIPIYNVEKYLDRCVQSVRNQTLRDIEIILVDDGSPDNCPAMCDEYAKLDTRIKVIHKENAGLGYARNSGLEIASGEYVAFVDSDDFVNADMYEKLYNTAKSNKLDTCYCSFKYYNSKTSRFRSRSEVKDFTVFKDNMAVKSFLLDMIGPNLGYPHEVKYLMCVWKAIYSLDIIKLNNILFDNEKVIASEDILFHCLYLPKAKSVGFIPDCCYNYCDNENSISRTYDNKKFHRIVKCLYEVRRRLDKNFSLHEYLPHYQRYLFLSIRSVIFHEVFNVKASISIKRKNIKCRLRNEVYSPLFEDFQYKKLDIKRRILYTLLKYKLAGFIILFYYIQKFFSK